MYFHAPPFDLIERVIIAHAQINQTCDIRHVFIVTPPFLVVAKMAQISKKRKVNHGQSFVLIL